MNQVHYIISDAAKELHVEPHVLRYWEEEMHLQIPRNKMGHRQYGEKELHLFRQIMKWKDEGLSLKEIEKKCIQTGMTATPPASHPKEAPSHTVSSPPRTNTGQIIPYPQDKPAAPSGDDKMIQFRQILGRIVSDAIRENSTDLTADIASHVSDQVSKELDFLFREKEEADEKRYRSLDETIRSFQKARQEAAAAQINENKAKNKRRFGKK